jgi:hypothetical protein
MKRNGKFIIGGAVILILLVGIVLISSMPKVSRPVPPTPTPAPTAISYRNVKVLGGLIFQDKAFIQYMHDKYYLDISETMMGSFAQADADLTSVDCVVPGSVSAADYFASVPKNKGLAKSTDTIMRTYIVVYSWKQYIPTLEKAGLVTVSNGVYTLDMKPIFDAEAAEKKWSDLGVDIPGPVNIEFTDPLKSSSGMVFMGMQADYLVPGGENGGKVVTSTTLPAVLPSLVQNWNNQGRQETSSPNLFQKFLESGPGKPMIVNYESAYPSWYVGLSKADQTKADAIVGLYPKVTVNTDHILISLTDTCLKIKDVILTDPWVLNEAWTGLGMRNAMGEIGKTTGVSVPWLAKVVPSMPEPKKSESDAIQSALK